MVHWGWVGWRLRVSFVPTEKAPWPQPPPRRQHPNSTDGAPNGPSRFKSSPPRMRRMQTNSPLQSTHIRQLRSNGKPILGLPRRQSCVILATTQFTNDFHFFVPVGARQLRRNRSDMTQRGFGAASSTKTCTSTVAPRWASCWSDCRRILRFTTPRGCQSLDNPTPQEVHKTSSGGGAMIVDKYRVKEKRPTALCSVGRHCKQRGLRVTLKLQVQLQKPGQRRPAARSRVQLELPSSLF